VWHHGRPTFGFLTDQNITWASLTNLHIIRSVLKTDMYGQLINHQY
jgi:hypothetical protein